VRKQKFWELPRGLLLRKMNMPQHQLLTVLAGPECGTPATSLAGLNKGCEVFWQ
jgi:hypothetical protein